MKWNYLVAVGVGVAIGFFAKIAFDANSVENPTANGDLATRTKKSLRSALPSIQSSEIFDEDFTLQKPRPDDTQLLAYLELSRYSRDAVIAAALLSKNLAFLVDAAERFPDDPQVQLMVIGKFLFEHHGAKLPGEKAEWVERFKKSQPDNLLASMLLGSDLLVRGEVERALDELRTGSGQSSYQDFSVEASLLMEEALLATGHTALEAKFASGFEDPLASTIQIQQGIIELTEMIESGTNPEEKVELATLGAAIGNQLTEGQGGRSWVNQMFGLRMEKGFLRQLDPDLVSPDFAQTPGKMLTELDEEISDLGNNPLANDDFSERFSQLNEQQMTHYFDRKRVLGEMRANAWLSKQFEAER